MCWDRLVMSTTGVAAGSWVGIGHLEWPLSELSSNVTILFCASSTETDLRVTGDREQNSVCSAVFIPSMTGV